MFSPAEEEIGVITSGIPSPTLSQNIAMGYIKNGFHKKGTEVLVEVRKKMRKATVRPMPYVPFLDCRDTHILIPSLLQVRSCKVSQRTIEQQVVTPEPRDSITLRTCFNTSISNIVYFLNRFISHFRVSKMDIWLSHYLCLRGLDFHACYPSIPASHPCIVLGPYS